MRANKYLFIASFILPSSMLWTQIALSQTIDPQTGQVYFDDGSGAISTNTGQYNPNVSNQGAIDTNTGQYYPPAGQGVVDPNNGQYYPDVGAGYLNPTTGQFIPKQ